MITVIDYFRAIRIAFFLSMFIYICKSKSKIMNSDLPLEGELVLFRHFRPCALDEIWLTGVAVPLRAFGVTSKS